jgi:hypothetical protein
VDPAISEKYLDLERGLAKTDVGRTILWASEVAWREWYSGAAQERSADAALPLGTARVREKRDGVLGLIGESAEELLLVHPLDILHHLT